MMHTVVQFEILNYIIVGVFWFRQLQHIEQAIQ